MEAIKQKLRKRLLMTKPDPEVLAMQKELADHFRKFMTPAAMEAVVAELQNNHLGVTLEDVLGESRVRNIAKARRCLYRVVRELTGWSYPVIGKLFARDHTTILDAMREPKEVEKKKRKRK